MVGSVLIGRMNEEKDFNLIDPVFFTTSNVGGKGPNIGKDVPALKDAKNIDELKAMNTIVSCQGGDYTNEVYPKLRAAGWKGYWIDAASALRMEKVMALFQRRRERAEAVDVNVRRRRKLLDPRVERRGCIDGQRLVRPERRQHLRGMAGLREYAMIFQAVHWIVGGADGLDVEFFEDALRRQRRRGQFFVRRFPDFFRRRSVEQFRDAEIALQFQVRPVIQRIAQRLRNGLGPREKLVMRRGGAGAEFFRDTVAAHRAPLVMVAGQPDFKQVAELAVARDVTRRDMAVIIKNRLRLGILVVKPAGGF